MTCRCTRSTCGPTITRPGCPSATGSTTRLALRRRAGGGRRCLRVRRPAGAELVLDDIRARDLGAVPAIVEGPQLMPGFAGELPAGWGVWLVPDPGRTRLAREERLAKAEELAWLFGEPPARASIACWSGTRSSPAASAQLRRSPGWPVIEVPGAAPLAHDRGRRRVGGRPGPSRGASSGSGQGAQPTAPPREQGSRPAGQTVDGRRRAHRGALLPVRVRMRDEQMPSYLDGHVPRLRGQDR